MNGENLRSREIRWILLAALHQARLAGKTQSGGWLSQLMVLEILNVQGYDLTMEEMKDELEYLKDKGCVDKQKIGTRMSKFRILARGIDVLQGQESIPGIGIQAGR